VLFAKLLRQSVRPEFECKLSKGQNKLYIITKLLKCNRSLMASKNPMHSGLFVLE